MATINPTWTVIPLPHSTAAYGAGAASLQLFNAPWVLLRVTWTNVNSGTSDTCTAAPCGWLQDKSVQISGTTVTSVAITGSNDNLEFYTLNDPQGNALTGISAEKIEQLLENTWLIQPTVTTGTAVNITVFGRVPLT